MSDMQENNENDGEVAVIDRYDEELKEPSMYNVIYHNDHYTPIDFVIATLQNYFGKSFPDAQLLATKVHQEGKGIAGKYTKDIAITKVAQVNAEAKSAQYPLQTTVEEA